MKKRNKPHRARPVNTPMMTPTRDKLALKLRLSVEALIAAPSPDTYSAVSKQLATIFRTGAKGAGLDLASLALTTICDRFERVHKVGVSEQEAVQLRDGAAGIDQMLATIPVNKIQQEGVQVALYCEEMGI